MDGSPHLALQRSPSLPAREPASAGPRSGRRDTWTADWPPDPGQTTFIASPHRVASASQRVERRRGRRTGARAARRHPLQVTPNTTREHSTVSKCIASVPERVTFTTHRGQRLVCSSHNNLIYVCTYVFATKDEPPNSERGSETLAKEVRFALLGTALHTRTAHTLARQFGAWVRSVAHTRKETRASRDWAHGTRSRRRTAQWTGVLDVSGHTSSRGADDAAVEARGSGERDGPSGKPGVGVRCMAPASARARKRPSVSLGTPPPQCQEGAASVCAGRMGLGARWQAPPGQSSAIAPRGLRDVRVWAGREQGGGQILESLSMVASDLWLGCRLEFRIGAARHEKI